MYWWCEKGELGGALGVVKEVWDYQEDLTQQEYEEGVTNVISTVHCPNFIECNFFCSCGATRAPVNKKTKRQKCAIVQQHGPIPHNFICWETERLREYMWGQKSEYSAQLAFARESTSCSRACQTSLRGGTLHGEKWEIDI